MMSHWPESSMALRISSAVSTRCRATLKPSRRRRRSTSRASSGLSSTIRTRNSFTFSCCSVDIRLIPANTCQVGACFRKLCEVNRFADIAVDAQTIASDDIALLIRRSEDNNGKHAGLLIFADLAQHFEAVDFGQFQVEQNDLRINSWSAVLPSKKHIDGFLTIMRDTDVVCDVRFSEGPKREQFMVRIVLDQEDCLCRLNHISLSYRKPEGGTLVHFGLCADGSQMSLDNA